MRRGGWTAVVTGLALTAVLAPVPGWAELAGRTPAPPVVVDSAGRTVGTLLGTARLRDHGETVLMPVAVTAVRVGGIVATIAVSRDHFVSWPVDTIDPVVSIPIYAVLYANTDCTGTPFLFDYTGSPSVPAGPSGPVPRTAIGAAGRLYAEAGPGQPLAGVASAWDSVANACVTPPPSSGRVFPVTLAGDLDALFTPPYSVR